MPRKICWTFNGTCFETYELALRIWLMRVPFMTLGILALLVGLLWIGQGTGMVNWPRSSFMISQVKWAYFGGGLAVIGAALIALSGRQA